MADADVAGGEVRWGEGAEEEGEGDPEKKRLEKLGVNIEECEGKEEEGKWGRDEAEKMVVWIGRRRLQRRRLRAEDEAGAWCGVIVNEVHVWEQKGRKVLRARARC